MNRPSDTAATAAGWHGKMSHVWYVVFCCC